MLPDYRLCRQYIIPVLGKLRTIVSVSSEWHLFSEFFHCLRHSASHNLSAQFTVLQQFKLLQQQPFLGGHKLLQTEVSETAAHLPQFLIPPLADKLNRFGHNTPPKSKWSTTNMTR